MLTEQEIIYGNDMIAFYRSATNQDQKKINDFVYADDKGKQALIKVFLTDIILAKKQSELAVYQSKATTLTAEITAVDLYSKIT